MKILFAADGSKYTKKAIAFLVTHESLAGPEDELVVLNVQSPVPGRVTTMLGSANVKAYHEEEAKRCWTQSSACSNGTNSNFA